LNLSITIPDALQITKVSYEQWEQLKGQLKDYKILENKDDFITFMQKTDVTKIKGAANAQYQQVMQQVDGMIATIQLN
jgi:hypothetical protein